MLITTVGTLLSFSFILVIYAINEQGNACIACVSVSAACAAFILLIRFYLMFFVKKKIDQVTRDLDELFDQQNRLVERIATLTPQK